MLPTDDNSLRNGEKPKLNSLISCTNNTGQRLASVKENAVPL